MSGHPVPGDRVRLIEDATEESEMGHEHTLVRAGSEGQVVKVNLTLKSPTWAYVAFDPPARSRAWVRADQLEILAEDP